MSQKILNFLPGAVKVSGHIRDLQQRWYTLYPLHYALPSQPEFAHELYEALRETVMGFEPYKREAVIDVLQYMFAPYGIEVDDEGIYNDIIDIEEDDIFEEHPHYPAERARVIPFPDTAPDK